MTNLILAALTLAGIAYGVAQIQAASQSAHTFGVSRTVAHHAPVVIRQVRK